MARYQVVMQQISRNLVKSSSEQLVWEYLLHLETFQLWHTKRKDVRELTKLSKGNKSYGDYDRVELYRNGKIEKLYNSELDK